MYSVIISVLNAHDIRDNSSWEVKLAGLGVRRRSTHKPPSRKIIRTRHFRLGASCNATTIRIGRLRITVSIASSVVNATNWALPDSMQWPRTAGFHSDSGGVHIKINVNQNVTAQTTQTPIVIEVAQRTHGIGNNRRYRERRESFTQSAAGLQNNALMYSSCTDKPLKHNGQMF